MARAAVAATTLTGDGGFNQTDGTFTTLGTGSGNGATTPYNDCDVLVLKNDSGGAAVFTIVTGSLGFGRATIGDDTVSVANNKTYLYKPTPQQRQSDGKVYIDCDVAGKILPLKFPTS